MQDGNPQSMQNLILTTIEFWEKKTGKRISEMEAKQAIDNIGNFFKVLHEWENKSDAT